MMRVVRATRRTATLAFFTAKEIAKGPTKPTGKGHEAAQEVLRKKAERLNFRCKRLCETHGFYVQREGPTPPPTALLVSNHMSYLDPPILMAQFPSLPIAKVEASTWPFIGSALRALGVMFVDRRNTAAEAGILRDTIKALRAGISVLVFPEGTTTRGDQLLPFERGAFGIAKRTGVPVVPIRISYDSPEMAWVGDASFVPHYLATVARPGVNILIANSEPLNPENFADADSLSEATRAAIEKLRTY